MDLSCVSRLREAWLLKGGIAMPDPSSPAAPTPAERLRAIGAYGFDRSAPLIFAALVTEDPLLLIGASGTGKTFLLNSLSEALGLEHRHYNASLISFDDLVGFPFPDADRREVSFLQTPATVWQAESVLIDEISRCKPEHQNRFFSLINERRIQGIALERLRFRWAAMNPCSTDQDACLGYAGSEPLDQALGDRFGLFITVSDWSELEEADQSLIANPGGEGAASRADAGLLEQLARWRKEFTLRVERCPPAIVGYAVTAVTFLNGHELRVSPRRARFIARSLLALTIVKGSLDEASFRLALAASLPQPTLGVAPLPALIDAAHRLAWDSNFLKGEGLWVHRFHAERGLRRKLKILLEAPDPEGATQAIAEFIGSESPDRVAAFCLALYPAAATTGLRVLGAEGVNDLGKVAMKVMSVDAEVSWQEGRNAIQPHHPEYLRFATTIADLKGPRRARAAQLFNYLLVAGISVADAAALEAELEGCVALLRTRLKSAASQAEEEEAPCPS